MVGIGAVEAIQISEQLNGLVSKISSFSEEHSVRYSRYVGHRSYGGYRRNAGSADVALHDLAVHNLRAARLFMPLEKHNAGCVSLTNIQQVLLTGYPRCHG